MAHGLIFVAALVAPFLLMGCGDAPARTPDSADGDADASGGASDASGADADGTLGALDADAPVGPDAGPCDRAEALCAPGSVPCTDLAASYVGGTATCRSDCRSFDVSGCALAATPVGETVKPALRDPRWSGALCSRSGEYRFTVVLTGSPRWILSVEGGGLCGPTPFSPCFARNDRLVRDVEDRDGALVRSVDRELRAAALPAPTEVPALFQDANFVRMEYCSNDVWSGTRVLPVGMPAAEAGGAPLPFTFTGRLNFAATLEILQQRFGLDDADPEQQVFFSGVSAGGGGLLNNADLVVAALPQRLAAGKLHALSVASVLTSGWASADAQADGDWSLWDTVAGVHLGEYLDTHLAAYTDAWQARFNPRCEAAHPDAPGRCLFARVAVPFIVDPAGLDLPLIIAQNRSDPLFQRFHGITTASGGAFAFAPGGAQASAAWSEHMTAELAGIPWLYAPSHELGFHGISLRALPEDAGVPRLRAVVSAFVTEADPAPFAWVFGRFEE